MSINESDDIANVYMIQSLITHQLYRVATSMINVIMPINKSDDIDNDINMIQTSTIHQ